MFTTADVTKPQDPVDKVDRKVDVFTETMEKFADVMEGPNVSCTSGRKVHVEEECRLKKGDVRSGLPKRKPEESDEKADIQDGTCPNSSTADNC